MALADRRHNSVIVEAKTDVYLSRYSFKSLNASKTACHRRTSSHGYLINRHDRWTVNLSQFRTDDSSVASNLARRNSLMMPLSTGGQSLLASTTTTTTLPSVFETDDNGRLTYPSHHSRSKTLRPPTQPNTHAPSSSSSTGSGHTLQKPSSAFDSTSSSPSTSTSSALNSAVTEPSPASSSPESPSSLMQAPFGSNFSNFENPVEASMDQLKHDVSPIRPSTSASDSAALRRGRNSKNLSINTLGISAKHNIDSRTSVKDSLAPRPVTQSGPAPTFKPGSLPPVSESAPVSPSFIIPKIPPRRKPSKLGLTLATPDNEQKAVIPPTPSFNSSFATRSTLLPTQLQTIPQTPAIPPPVNVIEEPKSSSDDSVLSPSLGPPGGMSLPAVTGRELRTPGLAPMGGMTLPPFRSLENSPSKRSSPEAEDYRPLQERMGIQRHRSADQVGESAIVNQTIEHINDVPTYDRPLSQEVKSPSYPEGPACIYPPNVYLYHQPTANEARNFDVIINVAREVSNPFEVEAEEEKARLRAADTQPVHPPKPSYRSVGVQVELLTEDYPPRMPTPEEPKTAASDISFSSAMERLDFSSDDEAPPTPKAARNQPEYLHLPWEHNSKVYEDWFDICQLIDERSKKGKKVLIHCQLGVSRSASLIVAYGIFLNPKLSPHEAREQAKTRSRWIDINMHFMYELGDFKKLLQKKGIPGAEIPRMGVNVGTVNRPTPLAMFRSKTETALSPVQSVPNTPMSALTNGLGSAPLSSAGGENGKFARLSDNGLRTPGPSSAPADVTWSPSKRPAGMDDDVNVPVPSLPDSQPNGFPFDKTYRMPSSVDAPARQPSPSQRTPGFDMPGGWAATPAMSRPTSMVFPEGYIHPAKPAEQTPQQSPESSPDPEGAPTEAKPNRAPSFRRLPRMPSLPSSFTSSLGSFFSLNRSASTSSKKSTSATPSRQGSISSRPQTRMETIPGTPVDGPTADSALASSLRKPPSLPSLRTFFPLGGGVGSSGNERGTKPGLSLTLDPIPQSAVGNDSEPGASQDEAFAALMSPRAQEFVSFPFNRPATSHVAMSGPTLDNSLDKTSGGFASAMSGFGQLGLKKQRSGQSLRTTESSLIGNSNNRGSPELGRKYSTGSQQTVLQRGRTDSNQQDEAHKPMPGSEEPEKDPRSPPSHGIWGHEERVMRNIDDVL